MFYFSALFISGMQTASWLLQEAHRRSERPELGYVAWLQETSQEAVLILLQAVVFTWLLRFAVRRLARLSKSQESASPLRAQQLRTLAGVLRSVGVVIIVFIAAMQALPIFGVDIKPILASAGIAGLAIGFGAQTLVKDVINGFFILVENQYNVGDIIKAAGVKGKVEAITLRRTVLRDADGAEHMIPNGEIKIVSNMSRDWSVTSLHITTAYSEDSQRVMQLLREICEAIKDDAAFGPLLLAPPEIPGIERVANGEVDYLMLVKTLPGAAQYSVSRELRRRIKECFEKNGIKAGNPARVYALDAANKPVEG
jgi:small-conductance mechanosensitive channel